MTAAPIYEATAFDHGFAPMPSDRDLIDSIARTLQTHAAADECYRCPTEPAGRIDPLEPEPGLCRGCLDEVSHANRARREDDAMGAGDDGWRAL